MEKSLNYLKKVKTESVVQSVINCLTEAMRNKELKPGDRIPPEPELARSWEAICYEVPVCFKMCGRSYNCSRLFMPVFQNIPLNL